MTDNGTPKRRVPRLKLQPEIYPKTGPDFGESFSAAERQVIVHGQPDQDPYSKIGVRLRRSLHTRIKVIAAGRRMTLSAVLEAALTHWADATEHSQPASTVSPAPTQGIG